MPEVSAREEVAAAREAPPGEQALAAEQFEISRTVVQEVARTGTPVAGTLIVGTAVALTAGVLLVKEAGGFVTDYRGADRAFERGEYVAAASSIHSKLQKLIAGALR